jgi:16S rRNA (uracil1498-N3)-methyltransferase
VGNPFLINLGGIARLPELFYLPPDKIEEKYLIFPDEESRHIQKSCRKGIGDRIRVTDGRGLLMTVAITGSGTTMKGEVLERQLVSPETCSIDLAVGMSKRERMSWLVEKGTELGVTKFFPLVTDWSKSRRHREEWTGHVTRWNRVAISALKQSQRFYLPEINPPSDLADFLQTTCRERYDLKLLLDRGKESSPVRDLLRDEMTCFLVLLGSEGGFNEDEISRISEYGFMKGRLIDRPLRFETAGISSVALIKTRCGNV